MIPTGLFGDLRIAFRALARRPGFTAVAVATLALGIGATTAVFTLVDRVVLRPLPFPESDRLVALEHVGRERVSTLPMSQGLYLAYREHARSVDGIALWLPMTLNLVVNGEAQRIAAQAVTPRFFTVLGAKPALGRTFTDEEGAPGGEQPVILSDAFWRSRFGADPSVIGRTLDLDGRLRPVVGVMPPGFGFPDRQARVWVPFLAAAGGALGTVVADATVRGALALVPSNIPRIDEIAVDLRVGAFAAVVALGCALFFGLFPLVRHDPANLAVQLRDGSARGATSGRERHRLRSGLVVAQMALALILLVGSGLMLRSFRALRGVDPGFDVENVLTAQITVPAAEIEDPLAAASFYDQLRQRVAAQPGVRAVGLALFAPLTGIDSHGGIEVEDHPRAPGEPPIFARLNQVSPGYFESLGMPVLEGRSFRDGDGADGARAALVSRSFAARWWPDRSAIGRRIRLPIVDTDWYTIVGIAGDVHEQSLEEPPRDAVYLPLAAGPAASPIVPRTLDVTIRTDGDPLRFLPVLRRELRELNARIPLSNPRTMADNFADATSRTSFIMALLAAASGIALLLGIVGIYGVISYVVSQRRREIGVRMALGATAVSVRGMVVRQGLALAALGVVIGIVAAASVSSVLGSLLFGVSALDPATYAAVAVLLVAVAAAASWIPAERAARVQPVEALREE